MELYLALPYLISGSICLVIGLILLLVKTHSEGQSEVEGPYQRIKTLLAYSAFLDVLVDIITILGIASHKDFYLLDYFAIPVIYFLQLAMISFALLGLVHSTLVSKRFWRFNVFSVLSLLIIYLISFYIFSSRNNIAPFSIDSYESFVDTIYATIIHLILYVYIFVAALISVLILFEETNTYDKGLVNIHSGRVVIQGRKFEVIVYIFMFYFLLALIDFLWHDDVVNTIIILINTAFFVIFVITILDLQDVYYSVRSVRVIADSFHFDASKDPSDLPSIQEKINTWISSPSKEWLTEGITLTSVAEKMRIKPRLLSGYLNDILGMNFNKWICKLRIEEAQKIMRENPSLPISEIAFDTGFSDTSSLSRIFKQITGQSPSDYKKSLQS